MAALGVGTVFIGYTVGLYGYCLIRGYNITWKQLWSPIWPPGNISAGGSTGAGHVTAVS